MFKEILKLMGEKDFMSLGCIPSPFDYRDIPVSSFQVPTSIPDTYMTDISMLEVMNQKAHGSCVGHAIAQMVSYYWFTETETVIEPSARFIYAMAKALDNYSGQGTYPRIGAKVVSDDGCATAKLVPNNSDLEYAKYITVERTKDILDDAKPRKVAGFAFVENNLEAIKQAIHKNKVLTGTMQYGKSYSSGKMIKEPSQGFHYTLWYGYETLKNGDTKIHFLNSWGKEWGKDGKGYFLWSDYVSDKKGQYLYDIIAYTDIPNEILEEVKEMPYQFSNTLKKGDTGQEVYELQKRLQKEGFFSKNQSLTYYFGDVTEDALKKYQCKKGIICTGTPLTTGFGQLGPKTRASLNLAMPVPPVQDLKPIVKDKCEALIEICSFVGFDIVVTDGYRSIEEQNLLYAQGRTLPGKIVTNAKGGESLHNYRVAFDVAFKEGNKIVWDIEGREDEWDIVGRIGQRLGLEWGGSWSSFVDRPHFQFTAGYTVEDFQKGIIDESKFLIN